MLFSISYNIDPIYRTSCRDAGFSSCCYDTSGNGLCDIILHDYNGAINRCSCNASCLLRGDCCPDADSEAIGCNSKLGTHIGHFSKT